MLLQPQNRFLQQEDLSRQHRDNASQEPLLRAAEASLLQLVLELPKEPKNVEEAAACYHAILGARKYMDKVLTIADPVKKPPVKSVNDNLNHAV